MKKQPTANQLREQLALAADEIIRLRETRNVLACELARRDSPPRRSWCYLVRAWWRRVRA